MSLDKSVEEITYQVALYGEREFAQGYGAGAEEVLRTVQDYYESLILETQAGTDLRSLMIDFGFFMEELKEEYSNDSD